MPGYGKIDPELGKATRFKPGNSGNPHGRSGKLKVLKDALKAALAEQDDASALTNAEVLARVLIAKGKKGNVSAIQEIANRTEGKPMQPMSIDVGIDDKTAQTIAELATTYNLLEGK